MEGWIIFYVVGCRRTNRAGKVVALPFSKMLITGKKKGVFRPETLLINRLNQKFPGKAVGRRCWRAEDEQEEERGMGFLPQ